MTRRRQTLEERVGNTLRQMSPGTLGGRIRSAAPIAEALGALEAHRLPLTALNDSRQIGHLLTMSASADSIASGGDYVAFDTIVAQHGFGDVIVAGSSWEHPISGIYVLDYEHAWDSYTDGGTVELEVGGAVVATLGSGSDGQNGRATVAYRAEAGASGRIKVTQSSGSAQTADGVVYVAVTGPRGDSAWEKVFTGDAFGIFFDGTSWWVTEGAGNEFREYDSSWALQNTYTVTDLEQIRGIGSDGTDLWIAGQETDNDEVFVKVNTSGVEQTRLTIATSANGRDVALTFDGTDLWTISNPSGAGDRKLERYSTAGTLLETVDIPDFERGDIHYEAGNVFTANVDDGVIVVFDTAGATVDQIDTSDATASPTGVWVADDGTIYISEDGAGVWKRVAG